MLEPNELLDYTLPQQQEIKIEETPEWLLNFLSDDDDYDIFSK